MRAISLAPPKARRTFPRMHTTPSTTDDHDLESLPPDLRAKIDALERQRARMFRAQAQLNAIQALSHMMMNPEVSREAQCDAAITLIQMWRRRTHTGRRADQCATPSNPSASSARSANSAFSPLPLSSPS